MKNKKTIKIQPEGLQLSHFTYEKANSTLGFSLNFLCSHPTGFNLGHISFHPLATSFILFLVINLSDSHMLTITKQAWKSFYWCIWYHIIASIIFCLHLPEILFLIFPNCQPHSSWLKCLDHKFRMSRQPWWHIASFNLVDDQRRVGVTSKRSWKRSQTYINVRFSRMYAQWGHTSLSAGFQQGAVASQPGRRQGNSGSDRLIGLDPDRLTRRAPPVRGPELTPWCRFNSAWRHAERLKEQQIPSLKASVSAAAVHYLTIAAQSHVTEGNKDKAIRFLREPNEWVTQLLQHFSLIGDK